MFGQEAPLPCNLYMYTNILLPLETHRQGSQLGETRESLANLVSKISLPPGFGRKKGMRKKRGPGN